MVPAAIALAGLLAGGHLTAPGPADTGFAATIAKLSEPNGFFWSDNLVSNETSYLHVLGALGRTARPGGVYIGVGPEQNFSYLARLRPAVAFIVDIRRDNLLLHLLFKAIFERADTRLEYLCDLYARPCPSNVAGWTRQPVDRLLTYIDTVAVDTTAAALVRGGLLERVTRYGVPITPAERATLERLYREFGSRGLDLTFSAYGGRAVAGFPTVRDLYLATDLGDRQAGFLATESDYRLVRDLERADRVIPVVGDLAGPHALRAIGDWIRERGDRLSVFYLSNIEFYLVRQGTFDQFVANVKSLPTDESTLLVRSYFSVQTGLPHPNQVAGHLSVQLLQTATAFLSRTRNRGALTYWDLMTEGMIPLSP